MVKQRVYTPHATDNRSISVRVRVEVPYIVVVVCVQTLYLENDDRISSFSHNTKRSAGVP